MRALLLLALVGCKSFAYECATDMECGTGGACETNRFCSFADSSCPSGRRYGEYAGNSLGNQCVGDPATDGKMIDAMVDARMIDTPPGSITKSFGETGTATNADVTFDTEVTVGSMANQNGVDHASIDASSQEFGIWRFNTTAIPTNATVIAAHIELSSFDSGNIFSAGKAQVYRILEQWDESLVTAFVRNAGNNWTTPNIGAPGSRDPNMLGEFSPVAVNRFTVTIPNTVAQSWVSNPATNCGVLVDTNGSTGHLHLATKENVILMARPLLVITYFP